jgi:hypothetical protein
MQLSPRSAMQACAILAVVVAATAVPGSSEIQVYPGACRTIDSMDADAWGEAVALIVRINGEDVVGPFAEVSNSQDGPGIPPQTEATEIPIDVLDGLVTAKILTSRVDLKVDEDPLRSQAWSQASVADLNINNGTVTAQLVKGWAHAKAEINLAETMTVDSNVAGLQVGDLADVEVAPGVEVVFPDAVQEVVGQGSFVKTYVREDNSSFPGNGSILYRADTTVTMLHVYLADVPGFGSVEVIVSRAHAHAEAPAPFCGLVQSVKAASYVARVRPDIDSKTSIVVGEQHVGVVGGRGHQQLLGVQTPVGPSSLAETNVTESEVYAYVNASVESRSYAMSKVLGLCIRQDGTVSEENATDPDYGDCFISATAIRAESNSVANETSAMSWGSVTIVGLHVAGIDVCAELGFPDEDHEDGNGSSTTNVCKPPQNSELDLGVVKIIFNQREYDEAQPGHTGYYVRAVRIQGAIVGDIIIGRAYTSADFGSTAGASGDNAQLGGAKA